MTLHVEERLLLKLLQFLGYVKQDDDVASTNEEDDESLYDNQRYRCILRISVSCYLLTTFCLFSANLQSCFSVHIVVQEVLL